MALTSIEFSVLNNEYKGYVEISSVLISEPSSNISYALLYRRPSNIGADYIKIYEKEISSADDLSFYCKDLNTRSGTSYDYYIELTDGNDVGYTTYEYGDMLGVESWFDGLFVGDESTQYLAPLDCETSTSKNTQLNYVTTLSGRTPYRISNTNLNYITGQSSAIFMPLDQNMDPIKQNTKEYTNQVVDFLSNGESKILKTSDGDIWYVSIDENIQIDFNNYYKGYYRVLFNWAEIDEVPFEISSESTASRLVGKMITENGTYYPSGDNADGYSFVSVNVPSVEVRVQGHTLIYQTH